MHDKPDFRLLAYGIVVLGAVISLATAVVPFYDDGHQLLVGVLLVGLMPYLVYGVFAQLVRGWPLLVAGVLLLAIDLTVELPERFPHYHGYAGGLVYYAPLVSTFVVLPVVLGVGAALHRRLAASAPSVPPSQDGSVTHPTT